jgi:hypothetical protein
MLAEMSHVYKYRPPMMLLINFVHEGGSRQGPPKRRGTI